MDTTNYIKYFALIDLVLGVVYVVASISLESSLPPLLQEYLQKEIMRTSTVTEDILLIIAIPTMFVHIASLIGFIFIKNWARNGFIYSSIVFVLLVPFAGPYLDHAIAGTIDDLASIVVGVIIALLFFTNSAFNKSIQREATPPAV